MAIITIPGTEVKTIGFITSEDLESFYHPLKNHVAVYIQQTFQIAGMTFLIPKEKVEIIDVKPEDAINLFFPEG